jgi:hypothetical protein
MSYNLAYSVLTPITNGETGLQRLAIRESAEISLRDGDVRIIDQAFGIHEFGVPITNLFGIEDERLSGFYFCAVLLIICFYHRHVHHQVEFRHDAEGDQVQPEPAQLHRFTPGPT